MQPFERGPAEEDEPRRRRGAPRGAILGEQLRQKVDVEEQEQPNVPSRPVQVRAEDEPNECTWCARPLPQLAAAAGGAAAHGARASEDEDGRDQVDDNGEGAAARDQFFGDAAPEEPQYAGALLEDRRDQQHRQQAHEPFLEEMAARRVEVPDGQGRVVPRFAVVREVRREPGEDEEEADRRVQHRRCRGPC